MSPSFRDFPKRFLSLFSPGFDNLLCSVYVKVRLICLHELFSLFAIFHKLLFIMHLHEVPEEICVIFT